MRVGFAVVRGRSMEPTLYDGDRLVVLHGAPPRAGRLAVVRLPDGVVAVKRATRRQPDGWWVERDNPASRRRLLAGRPGPGGRRGGQGPAAAAAASPSAPPARTPALNRGAAAVPD